MNHDVQLKLQAYLDGELADRERLEVEALLAREPEAQGLLSELTFTQAALTGNEPARELPETREFFWSKIERQILREQAGAREPASAPSPWLWLRRILAPASGLALVLMITLMVADQRPAPYASFEVEMATEQMGAFTFRDHSERMTVVWLYDRAGAPDAALVSDPWHDD